MGGIVTKLSTPRAAEPRSPVNKLEKESPQAKMPKVQEKNEVSEQKVSSSKAFKSFKQKTISELPLEAIAEEKRDEKPVAVRAAKDSSGKLKGAPKAFRKVKKEFKGFRAAMQSDDDHEVGTLLQGGRAIKREESDKKTIIENLKDLTLIPKEDLEWLLDEMLEVSFKKGQVVYKKDQKNPFFFVVVKGEFVSSPTEDAAEGHAVNFANPQALLTSEPCKEFFICKEEGSICYISRLLYQKTMVAKLKSIISAGQSLLSTITEIPGLKELPPAQREQIANAFKEIHFLKGEVLMKQGEEGATLFFIQAGEVIVSRTNLNPYRSTRSSRLLTNAETGIIDIDALVNYKNGELVTARRSVGEYIGEGALLESLGQKQGKRNANVIALTDVVCLALEREDFEAHLGSLKDLLEHGFCARVLKSIDLMKELSDEQLFTLASMLEECVYEKGDYVVTQGEQGDEFYIVKDGMLECTLDEGNGNSTNIGTLVTGDYFGEGALLTNEPRRCNIIAVGSDKTKLWSLSRANFAVSLNSEIKRTLGRAFVTRKEAHSQSLTEKDRLSARENINFSDLEVVKTLGSGSYGTVELVRNKITGQTSALKRIRKATVIAKKQQRFIQNERELLSSLKSPFIIFLLKTFRTDDSVYMLFEVCLGGELYNFMKDTVDKALLDRGVMPDDDLEDETIGCFNIPIQTRFFVACIALAIEYIQSEGIIHRDIKPENLMLTANGYLKLVDFGFAKRVFDQRTYSLCGTPEYTSPEVFKRIGHGKQADYWALGVILYEMASGFSPFHVESQNSWDCYVEISKYEKFYPNIQFPSIFSESLVTFLLQLMCPNPSKRFGTKKLSSVELKNHAFFQQYGEQGPLNWKAIEAQEYVLASEFRPKTPEFGLDVSNFEDCKDRHDQDYQKVTAEMVSNDLTGWDFDF